jgi:hypothetical protein
MKYVIFYCNADHIIPLTADNVSTTFFIFENIISHRADCSMVMSGCNLSVKGCLQVTRLVSRLSVVRWGLAFEIGQSYMSLAKNLGWRVRVKAKKGQTFYEDFTSDLWISWEVPKNFLKKVSFGPDNSKFSFKMAFFPNFCFTKKSLQQKLNGGRGLFKPLHPYYLP